MATCIGITGTNGAGKGTVVELIFEILNGDIAHYSMRDMIIAGSKMYYGATIDGRDDLREYANRLRSDHGPAILVEMAYKLIQGEHFDAELVIVESLRCLGEIDYLERVFGERFTLVAVDATEYVRYGRVVDRGSMTDHVTFAQFCDQEDLESRNRDPWKQNLRACAARATQRIDNNGTKDGLRAAVRDLCRSLGKT